MFKIGEFSKITQVSVRMLRYYDEQKLLVPCMIDETNGYRLYSAGQIEHLNRIILLRDMGFGVKEMREMLQTWTPDILRNSLLEQKSKVESNLQAENRRLVQIQGMLHQLEYQGKNLGIEVILKQLPMQHVLSLRRVVADYYCEGALWEEMGEKLRSIRNADSLSCFSIYHDLDYREEEVDIEICVVMERNVNLVSDESLLYRQVTPVEMAACFMVYGPYSNISRAYQEFATWLERHPEYCMAGENRQLCHVTAANTANPEEYITELQIPLAYSREEERTEKKDFTLDPHMM